jgi:hypothetical protein
MTHAHLNLAFGPDPQSGPSGSGRIRIPAPLPQVPDVDAPRPPPEVGAPLVWNAPVLPARLPQQRVPSRPVSPLAPPLNEGLPGRRDPVAAFPLPIQLFQEDAAVLRVPAAPAPLVDTKKSALPPIIPGFKASSLAAGEPLCSPISWPSGQVRAVSRQRAPFIVELKTLQLATGLCSSAIGLLAHWRQASVLIFRLAETAMSLASV